MTQARDIILKVMSDVQGLAKKQRNESQNFNFRGIDAVMNAVGPALREAGGFILPELLSSEYATAPTKSGGITNIARLHVQFSVYGSEGEPIVGTVAAEANDTSDKATSKAMSVAYRTFLLQLLCLPTDEPDPDSFTYELGAPAKGKRDWQAEIDNLNDVETARLYWTEAKAKGAPAEVMAIIEAKAASLA